MEEGLRGLEGFEDGNFSAALHQELLFDYKPEIAEKLAGEFDLHALSASLALRALKLRNIYARLFTSAPISPTCS